MPLLWNLLTGPETSNRARKLWWQFAVWTGLALATVADPMVSA